MDFTFLNYLLIYVHDSIISLYLTIPVSGLLTSDIYKFKQMYYYKFKFLN